MKVRLGAVNKYNLKGVMILPITKKATLVSNSASTYFSTLSRQDAINGALGISTATNGLVAENGQLFPFWPELVYYAGLGQPTPQYVWNDATPAGPETLYFAQAFSLPILTVAVTRLATAETFSDNAHRLFLQEFTRVDLPLVPPLITVVNEITPPGGILDGSSSDTGQASAPPFSWQTISKYSNVYIPTLPVAVPGLVNYAFVVSYEVNNYSPNGPVNPAGLQYIVELYDDLL